MNSSMQSQTRQDVKTTGLRWGIILAGGEGKRMQPFIEAWLGEKRPKQYCVFTGTRSMIGHTVDRACALVSTDRVVTIIGRGHREWVPGPVRDTGITIEQPRDLGAAPGVFLPLAHILARDPKATVMLLPSDHYVYPEERFVAYIERACEVAECQPDHIVLLGAVPDRPEQEYGWIRTEEPVSSARVGRRSTFPFKVTEFREKPSAAEAQGLFNDQCLWSTMVGAVKGQTLWEMGRKHLPEMVAHFDGYRRILQAIHQGRLEQSVERMALEQLYRDLQPADFSTHILQHAAEQTLVLPMHGVDWCDWGQPHRIHHTLARAGRRPTFPPVYFEDAIMNHGVMQPMLQPQYG